MDQWLVVDLLSLSLSLSTYLPLLQPSWPDVGPGDDDQWSPRKQSHHSTHSLPLPPPPPLVDDDDDDDEGHGEKEEEAEQRDDAVGSGGAGLCLYVWMYVGR